MRSHFRGRSFGGIFGGVSAGLFRAPLLVPLAASRAKPRRRIGEKGKRLKRMVRRIGCGVVLVLLLAVAGGAWLLLRAGTAGEGALERWIGGQLQRIVSGYLHPDLVFETLDYQAPRTVVLTGVQLIADDAEAADGRSAILEAARLRIELDKIPREGQPLVIRQIDVTRPVLRALMQRDGDGEPAGMVGWDNLVRSVDEDDPGVTADQPPPPLSEVFRMRQVNITDGALRFDERDDDRPPMKLEGFTTRLTFDPDEQGWYTFALKTERPPLFEIDAKGRLDLDGFQVELSPGTLSLDLASEQITALPPAIQQLLQTYEARGQLRASIEGLIPLRHWPTTTAKLSLDVRDAHFAVDQYQLPVQRVSVRATVDDQVVTLGESSIRTLGGRIVLGGKVHLNQALSANLNAEVQDVRLEQAARLGGEAQGAAGDLSGRVTATATFVGPISAATTQAGGGGTVQVRDGRLANLPLLSGLFNQLRSAGKFGAKAQDELIGHDNADVTFELRGDHAELTDVAMSTPVLALEGTGRIGFDRSLYLNVKAGPLKKLEQSIGVFGKGLGQLTDNLIRYRVTGTLAEPKVTVLLMGAPDDAKPAPEDGQRPASELFEQISPGRSEDGQSSEEDDAWDKRRQQQGEMIGR